MDLATHTADDRIERSWFRSPQGVRLAVELAAIILAKIIVLVLLYFFLFAQPRVQTSPAAMRDHLAESHRIESGTWACCDDRS
jgi:hypothetical protein